ncbi:MAG: hypothetical protein QNJ81_02385 [Acidimicrobiia bacterium]|nr:hypothetical protein [Acidimicrobiia bacterium]
MADRSSSFTSLLAAALVALTGLIPVVWLLTSPAERSVVEEDAVVVTATTAPPFTVVVEPAPQLEVEGLDPAVVRVLQANGYAQLAGRQELVAELPPAVIGVLIEHNAVLTVVEEAPPQEEG